MSGLNVDTKGLGQSAESLKEVGERIEVVRDEYLDKISSYHGCWGDGEFGETFASKYLTGVDYAKTGIKELSSALSGSATSLLDASSTFAKVQDGVLASIQQHGKR
ncbi:hypothetical protein ACF1BP_32105 [Streptomyces sp. NPDC014735]|uniref:hypothetical protein n=1 Tax=unclassified Streptomyces TaxID=2593676 RepID=UPI0036CFA5E3